MQLKVGQVLMNFGIKKFNHPVLIFYLQTFQFWISQFIH